jgi:hypothetical protein
MVVPGIVSAGESPKVVEVIGVVDDELGDAGDSSARKDVVGERAGSPQAATRTPRSSSAGAGRVIKICSFLFL